MKITQLSAKKLLLALIFITSNSLNSFGAFIGGELTTFWQEDELKVLLKFYFQEESEVPQSVNAIIKDDSKIERANLDLLKIESNVITTNYPLNCTVNPTYYEVIYSASASDIKDYGILKVVVSTPIISNSGIDIPEVYNSKLALVVYSSLLNSKLSTYSWKPFFVGCSNQPLSTELNIESQTVEDNYGLLPAYISYLNMDINPTGLDCSKVKYTGDISFNNPLGDENYLINEEEKSIYLSPNLTGAFLVSEGITSKNTVINHRIYIIEISPI